MEAITHAIQSQSTTSYFREDKSSNSEPCAKKRCIRFASDLSAEEDPTLVSDSGFGDLPSVSNSSVNENGDLEVSSFFDSDLSNLPDIINHKGKDEQEGHCKHPEETSQSNLSSSSNNSDPCCSSSSSSSCSRSSSANDNHQDQDDSDNSDDDDESSQPIDDNFIDLVLNSKEISANPSRAAMMQRFLSHLRSNPNDAQLQHFLSLLLSGPEFSPPRHRLRHVTTIEDAARLLRCSKKILVLTGAGISVSCGIPDFRSKDGLYSRVAKVFPELRDPQSVFDIRLFRRDPRPFFLTAKELYPGQFHPSLSHKFINKLESRGQLLRNYSQNIDTLETIAGIEKVTMCHGSFATATCIRCQHKVSADEIKDKVLNGEIPYCGVCSSLEETSQIKYPLGASTFDENRPRLDENRTRLDDDDEEMYQPVDSFPLPPVLKPDIVFFGEDLPDEFHNNLQMDKPICDLVLVIGSSLRVRPVSLIPGMVPIEIPQILINREALPHCRFDVELLGNCDHIIGQLCKMMGPDFLDLAHGPDLQEIDKLPRASSSSVDGEIIEPTSEHDIQALKTCWEPKMKNEKLVDRLPADTYLCWRQRQYIFDGAEEIYDPDEEEDDSSSSSSSARSSSSSTGEENRDKEVDDELRLVSSSQETLSTKSIISSSTTTTTTNDVTQEAVKEGDKSN